MAEGHTPVSEILEASDLEKLTVADLKPVAEQWGVSTSGSKKEIAKRIVEAQQAAPGPDDMDPLPDEPLRPIVVDPDTGKPAEKGKDRVEEYEVNTPDGDVVTIRHNIDTGETSRK